MSEHEEIVLDEWELKLEKMLVELKSCQESNSLKSCTPCSAFFECEKYFSAELLRPRDAASTQSCRVY